MGGLWQTRAAAGTPTPACASQCVSLVELYIRPDARTCTIAACRRCTHAVGPCTLPTGGAASG
eukprot:4367183-Prymnesium_polylepis.1